MMRKGLSAGEVRGQVWRVVHSSPKGKEGGDEKRLSGHRQTWRPESEIAFQVAGPECTAEGLRHQGRWGGI